jgi:hypothetical protein
MTVEELIVLMERKLTTLNVARTSATNIGDLNQIVFLDGQIILTQTTLDQLRTLV